MTSLVQLLTRGKDSRSKWALSSTVDSVTFAHPQVYIQVFKRELLDVDAG